jgi:glutaredoxin-like YruB-family protein
VVVPLVRVKLYTMPTCPYCDQVKEFLREHNIEFEEVDVQADEAAAKEMIQKSGQAAVPVIDIEGKIIVGFDREKLSKVLGL